MQLINKKILIISPQDWGKMFLSKHHYAVELASKGNEVYFLNPPNALLDKRFSIEASVYNGLFIIQHKLKFPYNLKFRFEALFHFLMSFHIKALLKYINKEFDIIWSFDLGNLYPFKLFPGKALKVFHPVDEPLVSTAIQSAKGCHVIFSVTEEILKRYHNFSVPKYCINHGLSKEFIIKNSTHKLDTVIKVGFSGNLLRADIDKAILLKIIHENPEVEFNCWGSYKIEQSNIAGSSDDATAVFIQCLRNSNNVILHGVKTTLELAEAYQQMDAFLICYDVQKDQSKGTNYHKVLEFISTGKIIISNNITTYQSNPELVQMVESRINNHQLPALFKSTISAISLQNDASLQEWRKRYASDNLYEKQIERIEKLLTA